MNNILAAILISCPSCISPGPSPVPTITVTVTPSPAPTAVVTPIPIITPSPTAAPGATILNSLERPEFAAPGLFLTSVNQTLAHNEVGGFVIKTLTPCSLPVMAPTGLTVTLYSMLPYTTTIPSYKGGATGAFYDALAPYNSTTCQKAGFIWADVAVAAATSAGVNTITLGGATLNITVNSLTMPQVPTLPIYMGVQSFAVLAGHGLSPNSSVSVQGPLLQQYVNMLRANRIEPYGQAIAYPGQLSGAMDIDNWSALGGSYRELVLTGAIAPPMMGPLPIGTGITAAQAQAIQATAITNSITGEWYYVVDEPAASQLPSISAYAATAHAGAPSLKTMVTTMPQSGVSGVDIYAPVENQFAAGVPKPFFLYVSCMSHGACSGTTPGALTGQPDLMLDETGTNEIAFPLTVKVSGGSAALYYNSMQAYAMASPNPWVNQYQFAANGDGNLFYPGIAGANGLTANQPVASVRLKLLRLGSYLADYSALSGVAIPSSLVGSTTSWSKSAADYQAFKNLAAGITPKVKRSAWKDVHGIRLRKVHQ